METPNKAEHNLHSTFAKITYLVFKLILALKTTKKDKVEYIDFHFASYEYSYNAFFHKNKDLEVCTYISNLHCRVLFFHSMIIFRNLSFCPQGETGQRSQIRI